MTSLDFGLKKIHETRYYLLEEIKRNNLKSEKHKKCVNCFEHFIFISTVSGCVSVSVFASLVAVLVGITSSAVGLKITHMWRKWGTPQNFCLAFIDELEKQLFIKKNVEVSQ